MVIRLEQWSIKSPALDPWLAPEDQPRIRLAGLVYGHPKPEFEDGHEIVTSEIVSAAGKIVEVASGHTYELGEIAPAYREWLRQYRPNWDENNPITVIKE